MTDRDQLRRLLADTASLPGRWHWAGNAKHHAVTLSTWVPGYGRVDVLSCRRAGMHGAEFRFCDPDSMMLQPVRELVQYEVCHAATSPDDPRVYRHDIDDVRHPDARLIVAAVNALPGLLDALDSAEAEIERLRAFRAEYTALTSALGFGDNVSEPAAPPSQLREPIEEAFSDALEHQECPIACELCGERLADTDCEHCNGSGANVALTEATLAYAECKWCAGAGRIHVGCIEWSYADLAAEVERLRTGIEALADGWVHNGHPDAEGEPECPGCWAADLHALLDGAK